MIACVGRQNLPNAIPKAGDVGEIPPFLFSISRLEPASATKEDGRVLGRADDPLVNRWFIYPGVLNWSWPRQTRSLSEHQ